MQSHKFLLRAAIPGARRLELVKNSAEESTLYVYGVIGESYFDDGITALDFAKQVAQA